MGGSAVGGELVRGWMCRASEHSSVGVAPACGFQDFDERMQQLVVQKLCVLLGQQFETAHFVIDVRTRDRLAHLCQHGITASKAVGSD